MNTTSGNTPQDTTAGTPNPTHDTVTVWWVCDDSEENAWGRNATWVTLEQAKAYGIEAFLADEPKLSADQLVWRRREAARETECWDLYFVGGSSTDVQLWAEPVRGATDLRRAFADEAAQALARLQLDQSDPLSDLRRAVAYNDALSDAIGTVREIGGIA